MANKPCGECKQLKPCPKCGSCKVALDYRWDSLNIAKTYFVYCHNCNICFNGNYTEDSTVAKWNHRPAEDALKAEVERLKKQVADREDEGYAGFVLGVDQMKKKLAEKDKEIERLKSDLGIQKNLINQVFFESNRAYQETEKWKKIFYDLIEKQWSVSTDPKVIVVGKDTDVPAKESEGEE